VTAPAERPVGAELRVVTSGLGTHLFVVDGSRLYDIAPAVGAAVTHACVTAALVGDLPEPLTAAVGLDGRTPPRIDGTPLPPPPLRSLSLNVAQACNMGCHYCYADAGKFGGRARLMSQAVAEASVDRLIAESEPGASLVLGFMGGEPLLNRDLVHRATRYGARAAARAGRSMRFSITTNATLLTPEDAELFAEFPFSVQVSIDGDRDRNDAARPMNDGGGSYDRIVQGVGLLRRLGPPGFLAARVTVTPRSGELLPLLDHLISLGFDEVGFAAVVVSPNPRFAFGPEEFPRFLARMIVCGRKALAELRSGRPYPFGNFETAMQEIHRGSHRPHPCGAGAAYLSVNAEGGLFACHRLIDDSAFAMGDVRGGSDLQARSRLLAERHVDRMEPCRSCWARYLCGGGCYHEVSRRGRVGCDYIRGWLEFCLGAYAELSAARPEYFLPSPPGGGFGALL
jgi:uncharacterized protein